MQHLRDNQGVLEASSNGTDWQPVALGEGGGGSVGLPVIRHDTQETISVNDLYGGTHFIGANCIIPDNVPTGCHFWAWGFGGFTISSSAGIMIPNGQPIGGYQYTISLGGSSTLGTVHLVLNDFGWVGISMAGLVAYVI